MTGKNLSEAAAWSGLASNDTVELKHRLDAALMAIEIYEAHLDGLDKKVELGVKTALAYTDVDALVTKKHAQALYEDIMRALYSAGAVSDGWAEDGDVEVF